MSASGCPRDVSVSYPSERQKNDALYIMRQPGLSSQAYNQQQLNKLICQVKEFDANDNPKLNTEHYYKVQTKRTQPSTYDRVNHVTVGYDQKLHRDDRAYAKSRGLCVNQEETAMSVPCLSSSFYGHPARNALEYVDRKHVSVELCKKDFLRLGGTNIGSNPDLH